MIRFLLLGFLLSANAQQGPYGNYYYPAGNDFSPEQYAAALRNLEEFQNQEYEAAALAQQSAEQQVYTEELRIPNETPKTNDSYLCTAFRQMDEKSIISFEPLDSSHAAHHIILFVCEEPGIDQPVPVWDCGEMADNQKQQKSAYVKASPCKSASAPIYAWSHGAGDKTTQLPEGVGFPVGGYTKNQFIVLQVHYMNAMEREDDSGVKVTFTNELQPKTASTLLLVTGGRVKSQERENFEAACVIDEPVEMHPIAFRTHTHRHGEKVAGWIVNEDESGTDQWTLLGERDPQKPQIFEQIKNESLVIKQGDILTSRCTIYNNEDHDIEMGPTSEDEMCNFYLMYWTSGQPLSENVCYSPGAPNYHWGRDAGLNHIPKN